MNEQTIEHTLEEWRAEAIRRFGDNIGDWKFVCPACGRINTGREFIELGVEPNYMYSTCIGRHNGEGISGYEIKKSEPAPKFGCDWAAFGLFKTLGKGHVVVNGDGGKVDVFAFADPS